MTRRGGGLCPKFAAGFLCRLDKSAVTWILLCARIATFLSCVAAVEVGDVTTISLPYSSWCGYIAAYIPDVDKLFMSGGYICSAVDVFTSTKVRYAALVDLASGTAVAIDDKPTATGTHHPSVYYDDKIYTIGAPRCTTWFLLRGHQVLVIPKLSGMHHTCAQFTYQQLCAQEGTKTRFTVMLTLWNFLIVHLSGRAFQV
jgi:hypothetical protein